MAERKLGVIVNGATGGLAQSQHLRALLAIRAENGLPLANGDRIIPDLLLVGRSDAKLKALADLTRVPQWTTNLDEALSSAAHTVFFDAAFTGTRFEVVRRAIAAGKHIYTEKPIARTLAEALVLAHAAQSAGVKNGTVQDKLFLPGMRKLRMLKEAGFFGRILEVRLEFGRWIFDGEHQAAQRPSWNYRKAEGGGLILDMFPHWRYMVDNLIGEIQAVNCTCRTQISRRWDEAGNPYDADAEESVFAQIELDGGILASVNSSWCTRIRRDDVFTLQIDGTRGSAVAGAYDCFTQPDVNTPKPVLSVDGRQPMDFRSQWLAMPDNVPQVNSYRLGWELFLRHVAGEGAFPSPLLEGAKGVQLAELSYRSNRERRWIEVPKLA